MRLRFALVLTLLAVIACVAILIVMLSILKIGRGDYYFPETSTAIAATNFYVGTAVANTATARAATREVATEASP
jgi:hypothetical protein